MATQWFTYTGSNPTNPASFTPAGSTPPTCSGAEEQLCAIHAEDDANKPVLDLSIALEMAQALQNQVNTPNVKLKSR